MDIAYYDRVLVQAHSWAKKAHPAASPQRWAAFANSAAYLLTGLSGGYGGPSVREHAACRLPRTSDFDEACRLVDPVVFGPLTDVHRSLWKQECCFEDDPEDMTELGG